VLVLGVDNAGKTTLINTLKGEISDPESGNPTFGRANSTVKVESSTINFIDIGGGKNMRGYWKDVFCEVHAVVYVVDSACPDRFEESREKLFEIVQDNQLEAKPILLLLNKRDRPEAVAVGEVAKQMRFDELTACPSWQMQPCCALKTEESAPVDEGILEGLRWLSSAVAKDYGELDARRERDMVLQKEKEAEEKRVRKEALKKKRAEREAREAAEAAEAEAAAMAAAEASQVAVPMNISPSQQSSGEQEQSGEANATSKESMENGVEAHSSEGTASETAKPEVAGVAPETPGKPLSDDPPATPERIQAEPGVQAVTAITPSRLELPAAPTGTLPPLKGPPGRLEPIAVTPDKAAIHGVIQDSPTHSPAQAFGISNHPNVPPSPAASIV